MRRISAIKHKEFTVAENDFKSAAGDLFLAVRYLVSAICLPRRLVLRGHLAFGIRHLAAGIILSLVIIVALPANASGRVGGGKACPVR